MKEKIFNLLGISKEKVILCRSNYAKVNDFNVVMKSITKEEEEQIDKYSEIYKEIKYENGDIIIPAKDIYLYGEINFENPDDIDYINRFNLINIDSSYTYSNIDFNKGTFTTIDGKAKGCITYDPVRWFKYCYILLGKPKRIIVFKEYIKKHK